MSGHSDPCWGRNLPAPSDVVSAVALAVSSDAGMVQVGEVGEAIQRFIIQQTGSLFNGLTKKGKSKTGNHGLSHEIWDFPVICPLTQSIEL